VHLLTAQAGSIDDGTDPIDLGQTPGDIVVLTSADTEIAGLARAEEANKLPATKEAGKNNALTFTLPSLRLANILNLSHNYSVDLYIEQTLSQAKLIIIRVLGGPSYWQYGLDEVTRLARANNIKLAVISGSAYKDETLDAYSTIETVQADQLWTYLVEGGPDNYTNFLSYAAHLIDPTHKSPAPAKPLPKAGLYWPGEPNLTLEKLQTGIWENPNPVAGEQSKAQLNNSITAITFYRALLQSGDLAPIDQLIKDLTANGLNPLPVFAASLKDETATTIIKHLFKNAPPAAVINTTSFAISNPGTDWQGTVLDQTNVPVFQAILSGANADSWQKNDRGLIARDIAMNVALPEIDGRLTTRAISFKADLGHHDAVETNLVGHKPEADRSKFVSDLAANWIALQTTPRTQKRIALILSNYPSTDGRIANGVGLDTPAGTIKLAQDMRQEGFHIEDLPATGNALIESLQTTSSQKHQWQHLPLKTYLEHWQDLPNSFQDEVIARWGLPQDDPSFDATTNSFPIRAISYGNLMVGIQPGRGAKLDAKQSHHDATIPPTHEYIAFYLFLRHQFQMQAIIHMGKHGNLEWMPGKALALSQTCAPEVILGPTPHIYPFIVNDPGEGAQAKRRTSAVIIDHLTPPLTRAESYGPLKDLESLVDEYYEAAGVDPRRINLLGKEIIDLASRIGLSKECDIKDTDCPDTKLQKLDNFLCELKELQIRDGLHIFGQSPKGQQKTNLLQALTRLPRAKGQGQDQSLLRALAQDLSLKFDPLITNLGDAWHGPKPEALANISDQNWRSTGDTVERLEMLSETLINKTTEPDPNWQATQSVLRYIETELTTTLETCGQDEINGVITALDGKFIPPGPSGAPTRGRLDVLPTGRNFYTIDTRTIPTQTAWKLGSESAERVIKAYTQTHGQWPKQIALSAWGTSNMRTGGDDLAQALAFIGARPTWDSTSRRVTGFEIIPLSELKRPRVDLILRISGFFRDAFPAQIDLLQSAINAVADLDEDENANPLKAAVTEKTDELAKNGMSKKEANLQAKARIFGSATMQYGAGLKEMIHQSGEWMTRKQLAEQYIHSSSTTYGQDRDGKAALDHFKALLKATNLVVHNQDSREFDLLDSEDFYQFEGGLSSAVEEVGGKAPEVYHNDHSNPENPKVQTLAQEIAKIVRGRAANPKWIQSIMRHGNKGASEMLATVSNLSAFARLTNSVEPHHFEALFEAYLVDEQVHDFLKTNNQPALEEMAQIFEAAIDNGLWQPKRNSTYNYLTSLNTNASN